MTYTDLEINRAYSFKVGTSNIIHGPFKYLGYSKHSFNLLNFERLGVKGYRCVESHGEISKVKDIADLASEPKRMMMVSVIKTSINILN